MKRLIAALALVTAPAFATLYDTSNGRQSSIANGVTTGYTFFFPAGNATDVTAAVTVAGVAQGNTYTVALNSDQISAPGGTVTFTVAPVGGATVLIQRTELLTQGTIYNPFAPFPAKTTERTFDGTVRKIQQVDRRVADLELKEAADISNTIAGGIAAANLLAPIATGGNTAITLATRFAFARTPQDFGAAGTGLVDDTAKIQAAIDALVATGGVVRIPAGTYLVSQINMKADVWLYSERAVFKEIPNAAIGQAVVKFQSIARSGILGTLVIDGNRANQVNTGDNGQTGVVIYAGASDIYLDSVYAFNFSEDGLYIGLGGLDPALTPTGIVINRWISDNAGRNGVSITNGKNIRMGYVECRNTAGASPQAGFDFETNFSTDTMTNINVSQLVVHNNLGYGVQILGQMSGTSFVHGEITIDRLDSYSNSSGGMLIYKVRRLSILDGTVHDNIGSGIDIPRDVQFLRLNLHIYKNTSRGVNAAMTSQTIASSDWDFSGSVFRDNSTGAANTLDGIRIDSDDGAKIATRMRGHNVKFYDDQGGMTQRFGFTSGTNTSQIEFVGYIPPNATGNYVIGGTGYAETAKLFSSQVINYSGAIANATCDTRALTVTGAAQDDRVNISPTGMIDGMFVTNPVATLNTVRFSLCNLSGGAQTPGNIRLQITVIKP